MSELAKKMIEIAKEKKLKSLDLSDAKITDGIPYEIEELLELEFLDISNFKLSRVRTQAIDEPNTRNSQVGSKAYPHPLKSITRLINLRILVLKNAAIYDIEPLSTLVNLRVLVLDGTKVSDLSPITDIKNLTRLSLNRTPLSNLEPLKHLKNLQRLFLNQTNLESIEALKSLENLEWLQLRNTSVSDLTPLENSLKLKWILLNDTKVFDISPLRNIIAAGKKVWLSGFHSGDGVYLENCVITNPPLEILHKGEKAIVGYLTAQAEQETIPLFEAKILLVGEGGAGKTSLLRRMYFPKLELPKGGDTTRGIEIYNHEFKIENSLAKWAPIKPLDEQLGLLARVWNLLTRKGNKQDQSHGKNFLMRLNIWDFGGQQIYHSTHQFFLTKRSVYVLVDETRKDESKREDDGFKYWLEMIELKAGDSPVVFFQNQKGARSKALEKAGIQQRFRNVIGFFEGDLIQSHSADEIRNELEKLAISLPHVGQEWPKKWYEIRRRLEKEAMGSPFISQKKYFDIFGEYATFNVEKALELSLYLHDLGVILHFQDDPILKHIIILQNRWATEAVFKVLDDENVKVAHGFFSIKDCDDIWKDSIYSRSHSELRQLMMKFELCYELRDKKEQTWLLPQLLPPDRPNDLFEPQSNDIIIVYRYVQSMPRGLINRLMVRMNKYVKNLRKSWRSGVMFEDEGALVLAEAPFDQKAILFRGRGHQAKELMSHLTRDLEILNGTFDGLEGKVEKLVPCICPVCDKLTLPHGFNYSRLVLMKYEVGPYSQVQCGNIPGHMVRVDRLLDGFETQFDPDGKPSPKWNAVNKKAGSGIDIGTDLSDWTPIHLKDKEKAGNRTIKLFISYSDDDEKHLSNWNKQTSVLKNLDYISSWDLHKIMPGEMMNETARKQLDEADVIVLLVSSSFFDSERIWKKELATARERWEAGECEIAIVIVEPCVWQVTWLKHIAPLNKGEVISTAQHPAEAWSKAVHDLIIILERVKSRKGGEA